MASRSLTKENNNLNFRGGNPGAVQYGNFINYYKFHPPTERIAMLPKDIWNTSEPFVGLDIGCNAGDLTLALYQFIANNVNKSCYLLAIDIDPILIERAKENSANPNIAYECLDFMNIEQKDLVISTFLNKCGVKKFSACFCFSITMWIHLNYGDEGLKTFLKEICKDSVTVVVEPQPWKCYKSAVKRLKLTHGEFPHYKNIQNRNNIEYKIEQTLLEMDGVCKVGETNNTSWDRKISIFTTT
ncbi:hypothetical protein RI129_004694 [Pyrocoelia pectoralis]|uniref:RNA methyltransferase n=1 Tax=Pyrocoelia pectoralis TaxID=417401 RepID=A0AAN7VDE1_9COLE